MSSVKKVETVGTHVEPNEQQLIPYELSICVFQQLFRLIIITYTENPIKIYLHVACNMQSVGGMRLLPIVPEHDGHLLFTFIESLQLPCSGAHRPPELHTPVALSNVDVIKYSFYHV